MKDAHDERLDDALRAAFAPPPAAEFAAVAARVAVPSSRRWPWLLAAAALAVAASLWFTRAARGPDGPDGRELGALWVAAYEHALAEGFAEGECCEPGLDLRRECEQRFAVQLDLVPSSVHLLGCYCGLPTGGCMAILARTNDTPVCVYVLPRAQDPRPQLPLGSRFDLARREVGELVLYAISESVSAATLAEFVAP
jgi:hypothetical protein